jgi:glutamate-1-semialdehyde aminotransferase
LEDCDVGGIGGTLAGNALSLAAMRATLESVLTAKAFETMIPLATRFAEGVRGEIKKNGLQWNVQQLGARAEYHFTAKPPRNGSESAASVRVEPRSIADAVSQYGADVSGDDQGGCGSAHSDLCGGSEGVGRLGFQLPTRRT